MKVNLQTHYICWSPRILAVLYDSGFELWVDPNKKQENPFLDVKLRYNNDGILQTPKTGYIFERTPELMEVVGRCSRTKD